MDVQRGTGIVRILREDRNDLSSALNQAAVSTVRPELAFLLRRPPTDEQYDLGPSQKNSF